MVIHGTLLTAVHAQPRLLDVKDTLWPWPAGTTVACSEASVKLHELNVAITVVLAIRPSIAHVTLVGLPPVELQGPVQPTIELIGAAVKITVVPEISIAEPLLPSG
jgi:hypothetical protein